MVQYGSMMILLLLIILYIIDVACPFDTRVSAKEKEKIDKYQDLKREITRIWKCAEVVVVPVIIWALKSLSGRDVRQGPVVQKLINTIPVLIKYLTHALVSNLTGSDRGCNFGILIHYTLKI